MSPAGGAPSERHTGPPTSSAPPVCRESEQRWSFPHGLWQRKRLVLFIHNALCRDEQGVFKGFLHNVRGFKEDAELLEYFYQIEFALTSANYCKPVCPFQVINKLKPNAMLFWCIGRMSNGSSKDKLSPCVGIYCVISSITVQS